jgi:hypothetical protein
MGVALALEGSVPTYQIEDEEGRPLLIHLPKEKDGPMLSLATRSRRP